MVHVAAAAAGLHFIVFLGTVREPRNADRVKILVQKTLEERNITYTLFDPKELHLDKVVKPIQYYGKTESPPESLAKLNSQIMKADGFVVITAEYHGQIAPGLLNLMNQFPPNSYVFRPSAIVCYSKGRFGGIRAAMQLRTYLSDIGTIHVPGLLSIPKVEETIAADGSTNATEVITQLNSVVDQLVWFAEAIKRRKDNHGYRCDDCFDDNNLSSKGLPFKNKKWSK